MTLETERLRLLYELSRKLATFTDLDELLQFVTRRTQELLEAEGCAVLLHDRKTDELYFPIASQRASSRATAERIQTVRFPASQGVAGWALARGESIAIADVGKDERFYRGVDALTGIATRAIMYAPLRGDGGIRGLVSVVNPAVGVGEEHLQFLDAIAADIVVAFERTASHARARDEAREARWAGRLGGACLLGLGVALVLGGVVANAAVALPWGTLLSRPEVWIGAAMATMGAILIRAMRARPEGR